ncbi:MAG: hypothetical protein LBF79_05635 [Dysgonamonadaceae bacterium]|jgi:hypothetical protein|nr:hypothetical protein [Dysgonamonadaceae bacterium]
MFLPGYKKIEFADASSIQVVADEKISSGVPVSVFGAFTTLPVVDAFALETKPDTINGQTIMTTVVTLNVADGGRETRLTLHHLTVADFVFRLTDVEGKQWLLGSGSRPFPTVHTSFISESSRGGRRCFVVEIRYINLFSLLEIS